MSRIRSIKPEFFRHEELQDLEAANPGSYVMLVFIGLWTQSDKCGQFEWRPRQLKLDILPFLTFDMEQTLNLLREGSFIIAYQIGGKHYGYIPGFEKHQRITGNEAQDPPKYPLYSNGNGNILEATENHPGKTLEATENHPVAQGKGTELKTNGTELKTKGMGNEGVQGGNEQPSPGKPAPPSLKRKNPKVPLPENFTVSDAVRKWAVEHGHDQLDKHLEAFVRKAEAHGYRYVNWDRALEIAIAEDWAGLNGKRHHETPHKLPRIQQAINRCEEFTQRALARERAERDALDGDYERTH
jgi:hypothetical protein